MTVRKSVKKAAESFYSAHYGADISPPEIPTGDGKTTTTQTAEVKTLQTVVPQMEKRNESKIYTGKTLKLPTIQMQPPNVRREHEIEKRKVNIVYPLIPRRPKQGEAVFAYAQITWNQKAQTFVYNLIEPQISQEMGNLMEKIKNALEEKLDVDFNRITSEEAEKYLSEKIDEVISFLELNINEAEKHVMIYYIKRDFIGLGVIEPLMRDTYIEDISCDGNDAPMFIYHRNPLVGSVPTNIHFRDKDDLDVFVQKLAQKSGKSISMAEPLVDAALPDGSRLQATLSTDIARRGSNFTIRRFTEKPLSPPDLINFGAMDSRVLAYLWFCLENRKSMLISGGTATGKTTFLNVLSMLIRPDSKIVSIEDTPELRLNHPHWVPEVSREPISSEGGKSYGSVDMFDLLKSSLRQRPDYIIVGEVRGKEAYVLFQQIATGHTGLSTIHAENMEKLIDRLTTEPINLSPSLLESLDIAIFLKNERTKDGNVRRINEIYEITGFDRGDMYPEFNRAFHWDPKIEKFESSGSYILQHLADHTRMSEKEITQEIEDRTKIFEWMRLKKINDFRDATNTIRMYYNEKEGLMSKIQRDLG